MRYRGEDQIFRVENLHAQDPYYIEYWQFEQESKEHTMFLLKWGDHITGLDPTEHLMNQLIEEIAAEVDRDQQAGL